MKQNYCQNYYKMSPCPNKLPPRTTHHTLRNTYNPLTTSEAHHE